MKPKNFNINADDNVEKLEEEIIEAADKAGKKNVIVNIFSFPAKHLKRRWNVRYKFNKKHLVIDLFIAAGVLFLIGLNIFWAYGGFHYLVNKLDLQISVGSDKILSGDTVAFKFNYANNNDYKIEDAMMSLHFPAKFKLVKVVFGDFDYKNNIFNLGELKPGANGETEILGQVLGDAASAQNLSATIAFYRTDSLGKRMLGQFQLNKTFTYSIAGSHLELTVQLPDALVNGQTFDWPLKIKNTSDDLVYDRILVQTSGLIFINNNATIESLKPGEERELSVKASVNTNEAALPIGLNVDWQGAGFTARQIMWTKEQKILQPQFSIAQKADTDNPVTPGTTVNFSIDYNNAGEYSLNDAEVSLRLVGDYWDASDAVNAGKIADNTITWTPKEWPSLALIQPKETKEIKFSVGTKALASNSQDQALQSILSIKYHLEGQEIVVINAPVEIKLNSNLSAQIYPMYYALTGDQLGRGPLPPRVGQETKYWLFVKMINDIHSVDNVKVNIQLAPNVVATGRASVPVGDPLQFSVDNKTINWQISQVPVQPENIGFAFEIAIKPTSLDAGSYPLLMSFAKITGADHATGESVGIDSGAVTTRLIYDKKGGVKDGVAR